MQGSDARRTTRGRKVSKQMAVVDEFTRLQAAQARLDALENDNDDGDVLAPESGDEEFIMQSDEEDEPGLGGKGKKNKGKGTKRKMKGGPGSGRSPKTFTRLLEEAQLEKLPPGIPSYLTAAAAPSTASASLKFCSVCGNISGYTCARCGARFCSRKCNGVHTETRCLKSAL